MAKETNRQRLQELIARDVDPEEFKVDTVRRRLYAPKGYVIVDDRDKPGDAVHVGRDTCRVINQPRYQQWIRPATDEELASLEVCYWCMNDSGVSGLGSERAGRAAGGLRPHRLGRRVRDGQAPPLARDNRLARPHAQPDHLSTQTQAGGPASSSTTSGGIGAGAQESPVEGGICPAERVAGTDRASACASREPWPECPSRVNGALAARSHVHRRSASLLASRRLAVTAPPAGGRKGRFGPASFVSAPARHTEAPRRGEKSRRRVPFPDRTRRPPRPIPRTLATTRA